MSNRNTYIILAFILLAGLTVCILTGWYAYKTNGTFGFPLDDPWIHLQFAKNLHDYGSFSYYKNEMVTSGSTSPLYTILLAIGFFFTTNEMVLSYTLGIIFLLVAGWYLFKLSMKMLSDNVVLASAAALSVLLEARMQWASLSGMETTLFIALLLAVSYYYVQKNSVMLGVTSGFLLWTRPEAILFLLILLADAMYHRYLIKHIRTKKRLEPSEAMPLQWLKKPLYIFGASVVLYVGFNYVLSGSFLPNTYAAKLKYYSGGGENYPEQVFHFFTDGHMMMLACAAGITVIALLFKLVKRQQATELILLLWPLGLFLAYWTNLPFLYQEGRYMMPALPFIILLGVAGLRIVVEWMKRTFKGLEKKRVSMIIAGIISVIIIFQFSLGSWNRRTAYAEYCKYISDRQVRTAHWLKEHLPENAVVATHDIGAIAYYSGRKIADMVGLVSPEMINNIGSLTKLRQFLIAENVTHLALLRNWFSVVNVNPLFQTDVQHPEIMEVFAFDKERARFTPQNAARMTEAAEYYLSLNNAQQAGPLLEQSLRVDPQSSKTHCLLGNAFIAVGALDKAESELKTALQLHPDYWDALLSLAQVEVKQDRPNEAVERLEGIVQKNPDYVQSYRALAQIYQSVLTDTAKASYYLHRYNEFLQDTAR